MLMLLLLISIGKILVSNDFDACIEKSLDLGQGWQLLSIVENKFSENKRQKKQI